MTFTFGTQIDDRKNIKAQRSDEDLDDAWKDLEAAIGNVYHNEVFGQLQKAIQNVENFCVPTPKILAFVYKTYADLAEEAL